MMRAILNMAIEETNVQVNVDVATGHADVHVSAVMADDDDDDDSLTLAEISSALHPWPPVLDLDHSFGTVDSTVDFDRNPLLSPPTTPPPLFSPLLHLLFLLGSPPEIQEFSLS